MQSFFEKEKDMKALIGDDNSVICPFCNGRQFNVIRRELAEHRRIVKKCRCEGCGDRFEFTESKEGKPLIRTV